MDQDQVNKNSIREEITTKLGTYSEKEYKEKTRKIIDRLFNFANFLESKIILLYINNSNQVETREIIDRAHDYNKIIVLPTFNPKQFSMQLMKVDNPDTDLTHGAKGILKPHSGRCKVVPIESIDIAIIPGIAFDVKGGRIGSGLGYYDRFIPKLTVTTRKVSIAFEDQIVPMIPMESHDKYVDIIITEDRVIYKI